MIIGHWCSVLTALRSEDWQNETFVQMVFCATVGSPALFDIGAVGVLRECLW